MLPFQLLEDGADADLREILWVNPDFAAVGTAGLRHDFHVALDFLAAVGVVAQQSRVVHVVLNQPAQVLQMFFFFCGRRLFGDALFV